MVERLTVRRCRHFVCETTFAADFVREHHPDAVIHLIRTPISDEWFDVTRQPEPAAGPELLFVGRATAAKGIDVLLQAFPSVLEEFPRAVLHVVGPCDPGYLHDTLVPAMTRAGIEAHVRFHGHQPAAFVRERLATAALLPLPTLMDTAPNVLAESRAAGVPVVASAVGGIPELIEDGVDGLLVPAGSPGALAGAILRLLRDPAAARRLAERGRRRASEEHRAAVQVSKLIDVYRDMAAVQPGQV
jgi:glycosyltransferase involved in cell wall biosynthesis